MTNCCGDCRGVGNACPPRIPYPHVPKLDSVYCICGNETDYIDYRNYCAKKYEVHNLNSLGSPVGLVRALSAPKTDLTSTELIMQRFACYLKGFAHLILLPEIEWNSDVLAYIIKEGLKLFNESKKVDDIRTMQMNEMTEEMTIKPILPHPIYSATELKIIRSFELLNCYFDIELGQKFELKQQKSGMRTQISSENLLNALKVYFKTQNYCLIEINNLYALVWRAHGTFFVLDFSGRYIENFEIDRDGGYTVLMCLRQLENVFHFIAHLSGNQPKDVCTLREMKVTKLVHPDGLIQSTGYEERENEFVIVSPDYAYLVSKLQLSYKSESPLRTKSALPVGVAAILASKIDHPATWTKNFLKKIFCYGVNVCNFCWQRCLEFPEQADFNAFPTRFQLGQFLIKFTLKPKQYTGYWKCIPNYQAVEMMQAISIYFEKGITKLLIEIDRQVYAVWKKNEFIYLLDPYRHKLTPDKYDSERSASLRIFGSLDVFLFIFHQTLLQNNRKSEFFIHTLKIKKIEICNLDSASPEVELPSDEEDTRSLNETICFVDADKRCLEELNQFSEDEPEDALEEEEVIESEPEPPGEEEGKGEAGDLPDDE